MPSFSITYVPHIIYWLVHIQVFVHSVCIVNRVCCDFGSNLPSFPNPLLGLGRLTQNARQ